MCDAEAKDLLRWLQGVSSGLVELLHMLGVTVECDAERPVDVPDQPGSHITLETDEESHIVGLVGAEQSLWHLARVFMGLEPDEPYDRQMMIDSMGELANIVAGTLRDVLLCATDTVYLGLPAFMGGAVEPSGLVTRGALPLEIDGHTIYVIVLRQGLPPTRLEHIRMMREIRDRNARLRAVLDTAADAIMTLDEAGRVESANPAAKALFGAEVEGERFDALVPGWSPDADPAADWEGCDGVRTFPVELTTTSFSVGSRRLTTVFARDLTARRLAEAQLRQAQKLEAIGQLAAGVAHEINTPVQFVSDNVRFLRDAFEDLDVGVGLLGDLVAGDDAKAALVERVTAWREEVELEDLREDVPRSIEETLDGLTRITEIVRALKRLSHPDHDSMGCVDVNDAVETCLTVSRNEWKNVASIERALDEERPRVRANAGQLNQVLLNLIVNAAHAVADAIDGTQRLGVISIATRRAEDWVEIEVRDDGTGIPEAVRPRIFDPFFTTKEVGSGTGQGLAIAYNSVVKNHAGTLTFETEEGGGTAFLVRLPAAA